MFTLQSCKKEPLSIPKDGKDKINQVSNSEIVFRSARTGNSTVLNTVLGSQRVNPFEISKINEAHDTLYGTLAGLLQYTDLYVKFLPTTQEHIAILDEWQLDNDIPIVDYPLDYKVVTMGEQYIDPNVTDSLYTYRYAAIPDDGRGLPNVPKAILDSLYLNYSDPILIAESFRLTGHGDEITGNVFKGGLQEKDLSYYEENGDDIPTIIQPLPPECDEGCYPKLIWNDDIPNHPSQWTYVWVCHCPPPPGPTINECDCTAPTNLSIPAGCVQVEDDDNTPSGVQIATMLVRDNWFKYEVVKTDVNGCWEAQKSFGENVRVSLYFVNNNVKVRNTGYWGGTKVMYDFVEKFADPPYNNLYTLYGNDEANNNSKARQYWSCAHSLNTVNQYCVRASADNVPLPRTRLNWLTATGGGAGAAPMLQGNPYNSWVGLIAAYKFPLLYYSTLHLHPDIMVSYDTLERADAFIGVSYHELGHATHHELVGEVYWYKYRNHIINNNGYGRFGNFANASNEGHVALGEAIGNFTGAIYGNTADGSENGEWDLGNALANPPILPDNFIPQGLMFDLIDDTPFDFVSDPNDTNINGFDNISGFTEEMIFEALTPNITSIRDYRNRIRTLHLSNTTNTAADFNTFVDIYDVFNN